MSPSHRIPSHKATPVDVMAYSSSTLGTPTNMNIRITTCSEFTMKIRPRTEHGSTEQDEIPSLSFDAPELSPTYALCNIVLDKTHKKILPSDLLYLWKRFFYELVKFSFSPSIISNLARSLRAQLSHLVCLQFKTLHLLFLVICMQHLCFCK